jgi:serine protease Do
MYGKKLLVTIVASLAVGLLAGVLIVAPNARASVLGDFWQNLIKPFSPSVSSSPAGEAANTSSAPTVPLYKPALDYEQAVIAAVKKASPAVVSITISKNVPIIEQCPYDPFSDLPPEFRQFFGGDIGGFTQPCQKGTQLQEVGGGSGFIISPDGLILTNKHVVADTKASYTVFTNDGKKYDAKVLARDPAQDLAVVKINASGLPTVELGDSGSIELGQTAIAIGNALGEFRNTVSVGVISGLSRNITASGAGTSETLSGLIQTDAAINPGNSGGPLLNLKGQVIGIDTAVASNAQNIGFAIPINRAKRDIASVTTVGEIQAPFLGVRYTMVTADLAKQQKLPVDHGALVRGSNSGPAVTPDSPAAKARLLSPKGVADGGQAGVQAEDIITAVGGTTLDQDHALADVISNYNVGDTVTLTVNRGGKEITLQVTLAKRPASQ